MSGRPEFVATCSRGMEPVLEAELRELGLSRVRRLRGAVVFGAGLEEGYRALMWSRCASRILAEVSRFPCWSPDALYAGVGDIDWAEHIASDGTLSVDFVGGSEAIRHNMFGARITKDAIVDQLRHRFGRRPDVDVEDPDVRVNVHLDGRNATVSIDLAGVALHERGFHRAAGPAPLRETLAASLLRMAGWHGDGAVGRGFCDPMCGSGTLLIEAGLVARDVAPGLSRRRWGFDFWKGHNPEIWDRLVAEARDRKRAGAERDVVIRGGDIDPEMVRLARQNVSAAGLNGTVEIAELDVAHAEPPPGPAGVLVTNPPYGNRIGDGDEVIQLMGVLGDVLRRRFLGWGAWILVGSPEQARGIGLRPAARHPVWNGPLDTRLLEVPIHARAPEGRGPGWRSRGEPPVTDPPVTEPAD
jgi:23S rRNA (guanine2445-N2)-methyltransferase / 23S rRNA (guanine2069-N7)-methyltransferase